MSNLTHTDLKSKLHYDHDTGIFTWKTRPNNRVKIGDVAGALKGNTGYLIIRVNGVLYRAHRLAWFYVYGTHPTKTIDHINRDKLDNRISNLRDVDAFCQAMNRGITAANKTGCVGVSIHREKFVVKIRGVHYGVFKKKKKAIKKAKKIYATL